MILIKSNINWSLIKIFIVLCAVTLSPIISMGSEKKAKTPTKPMTTNNPSIGINELEFRLKPLTKKDLIIEVDGWLKILKLQGQKLSEMQVTALSAVDDAKPKLIESLTGLEAEQDALIDRFRTIVEELKRKGGKTEDYEAYITAISGLDLKLGSLKANWALVTSWIISPEGGILLLKRLFAFLLIILASWVLSILVGRAVGKAVYKIKGASMLLKTFIANIARKIIFIVGIIVALSVLGVNIGPLLATIGAAGFIVGFALQGTLSNFAAGIMILIYRPYDVGDLVEIGGTSGTVDAMTIVSTTLMTLDNRKVILPNNMIWGDKVTNVTGTDKRRIDMVFGIGYGDNIAKAQGILEDILLKHDAILKTPEPVVKVHELGDSSVNFAVRPWVKTDDYLDVYWDITRTVKERFDAEDISIPFPQRDVHLHQVDKIR